jgi:hypothetical protein
MQNHREVAENLVARMKALHGTPPRALGWITHDELLRLSGNNLEIANSIYNDVQSILHRT